MIGRPEEASEEEAEEGDTEEEAVADTEEEEDGITKQNFLKSKDALVSRASFVFFKPPDVYRGGCLLLLLYKFFEFARRMS